MIRFLKLGAVSIHGIQPNFTVNHSRLKCSLCNNFNNYKSYLETKYRFGRHMRRQSSNATTAKEDPNEKNISKDKFTDVLEVSASAASERKSEVTSLNITKMGNTNEEIANDFIVNSLHESPSCTEPIENVLNRETNDMLEELEEMEEEGRRGQEMLLEAMPLHAEAIQKSFIGYNVNPKVQLPKKLKDIKIKSGSKAKLDQIKFMELEKIGKEKSFKSSLIAYLEICINCGFLNRAWLTLSFYIDTKDVSLNDVDLYNILLEGYSKQGNLDRVVDIWKILEAKKIKPSVVSFAHRIEAIVQSTKHEKYELLNSCLRDFNNEGLDLNVMFNKCIWKGNSREIVLDAIRAVRPKFNPIIVMPSSKYNNPLVDSLNDCALKKNLSLKSPAEGIFNLNDSEALYNIQLKQEINTYVDVKSIEKEPSESESLRYYRAKLESMRTSWEKNIMSALNRDLAALNTQHKYIHKSYKQLNIYPYLVYLDKNQYREIIMHEIRKLAEGSESFSPRSSQLYRELGAQVRLRYDVKRKTEDGVLDKLNIIYNEHWKWYLHPSENNSFNARENWQVLKHKHQKGPNIDHESSMWPSSVLLAIGKFLYNIILRDIKIDVNAMRINCSEEHLLPAFYTVFRYQGHTVKEEVKPHPILSRLFRAACLPNLTFNVTDVPMLAPPIPWSTLTSGGYLVSKTSLIRLPQQAVQQLDRLNKIPISQIYPVFDALNQLSSIPWTINEQILDILIEVFNNGGAPKLDIPESPSMCPAPEPIVLTDNKTERFQAYRRRMIIQRRKAEMYSLWCDTLYRLSLANHFRDRIFWLPHNMDFRGRVYPCPPHLNHLGSDMSRSLLKFAKGEKLGPGGFDWLMIHLVNLTGVRKRESNIERLKYANSVLPSIIDSAKNPFNGEKWWMESEEPWQTLACCIEINKALENNSGVENFVSHFPVHQDGSCNGLQHYAALGRDSAGAFSVNLSSADVPQDVYTSVAAIVERERILDASNGLKIAQVLDGFVRRKVIKQTVMTTVYGVTRFGARLQIAKQLKDIDSFPKEFVWPASTYLVSKTFASLREMFTSTKEIQDWFTESAKMISQVCGENVEYITPLGLPVVQPYSKNRDKEFKRKFSTNYSEHFALDMYERPNVMKQKNAFPPNFIHSLDSTHMMLTSIHCERSGITFVSVHDCFWTHPKTLPIMNKICREQFVSLHSQPILNDLSKFMLNTFGFGEENVVWESSIVQSNKLKLNTLLRRVPTKGDFELSNVLKSEYFFS